jgi:hypothetical protein
MSIKRALVKTAAGFGAVAVLGTALIGVAHTPWGRPLLQLPLLRAMASHAGCPVGSIEPASFERVRALKLRGDVGTAEAAAHPALGFVLGKTARKDVEGWVTQQHASCKPGLVSSVLECENVNMAGAPTISRLRLQFDALNRLVSVDLFRSDAKPDALVARFQTLSRELDESVGPATSAVGTPSSTFVKSAPLQTVTRTYGYRDYVASAMLLNFGKRGVRLREQYQWLAPAPPA